MTNHLDDHRREVRLIGGPMSGQSVFPCDVLVMGSYTHDRAVYERASVSYGDRTGHLYVWHPMLYAPEYRRLFAWVLRIAGDIHGTHFDDTQCVISIYDLLFGSHEIDENGCGYTQAQADDLIASLRGGERGQS